MNNLVFLQVMSPASVTRGLLITHLHRFAPTSPSTSPCPKRKRTNAHSSECLTAYSRGGKRGANDHTKRSLKSQRLQLENKESQILRQKNQKLHDIDLQIAHLSHIKIALLDTAYCFKTRLFTTLHLTSPTRPHNASRTLLKQDVG